MSMRLSVATIRTYDALKARPGARPRISDARDTQVLGLVENRIKELIGSYRINGHDGPNGTLYVFWSEVGREVDSGAFDDLLGGL